MRQRQKASPSTGQLIALRSRNRKQALSNADRSLMAALLNKLDSSEPLHASKNQEWSVS